MSKPKPQLDQFDLEAEIEGDAIKSQNDVRIHKVGKRLQREHSLMTRGDKIQQRRVERRYMVNKY